MRRQTCGVCSARYGPLTAICTMLGPADRAVVWDLGQIVEALAYIHGRGVIHRDIKPPNIFLDSEGAPIEWCLALAGAEARNLVVARSHHCPRQVTSSSATLGWPRRCQKLLLVLHTRPRGPCRRPPLL